MFPQFYLSLHVWSNRISSRSKFETRAHFPFGYIKFPSTHDDRGGYFRGESGYLVRGNAPFTINLVRSGWCRWTASIHSIRGAAAAQGSTIRHATCCSHWTSNRPTLPPGCMWTGPRKRSAQVTRLAHLNPRRGWRDERESVLLSRFRSRPRGLSVLMCVQFALTSSSSSSFCWTF